MARSLAQEHSASRTDRGLLAIEDDAVDFKESCVCVAEISDRL